MRLVAKTNESFTLEVRKCIPCDKAFTENSAKQKSNLMSHITRHLGGTIECMDPDCNKMFPVQRDMVAHYKDCHQERKIFECYCGHIEKERRYLMCHVNESHVVPD
jgi:hypothetical protein